MSTRLKSALLEEYALIAQALSAPARLKLLEQLAQGPRGVERLAEKTGLAVANCSQHLQQLRRAGLVSSQRNGKAVIYELTDVKILDLMDLLRLLAERNLARVGEILRTLTDGVEAPEPVGRVELAARLATGAVTVLDMRPEDEYDRAHIPGALNTTLDNLKLLLPVLDPTKEIVAYCRGPYCIYSHQAVAVLRKYGLNARRLEGGLPEWQADGLGVMSAN